METQLIPKITLEKPRADHTLDELPQSEQNGQATAISEAFVVSDEELTRS